MYNAKQSKTFAVTGDSIIPSKLFGWDMSETFGYKSCTIAIFLAIIIAILLYVVINKTTFGYELKACGCNKNAARYAGINEKRSIILSMIIAGALAGLRRGTVLPLQRGAVDSGRLDGASLGGLRRHFRRAAGILRPDRGDLLGHLHFAHLDRRRLHERVFVPAEIADIISGIIIYLCAFSLLFKNLIVTLFTGKHKKRAAKAPDAEKPNGKEAQ